MVAIDGRMMHHDRAPARYTRIAIALHWTIAALLIGNIVGGVLLHVGPFGGAGALEVHKTIGILVLALSIARVLQRIANPPPPMPRHALTRWERLLSGMIQLAFYGLMLAIPLTGWILISTASTEKTTSLFLIQALDWPSLPVRAFVSDETRGLIETFVAFNHKYLSLLTILLLMLHVAGALKHRFIDRVAWFTRPEAAARRPAGARGRGTHRLAALLASFGFVAALALPLAFGGPASLADATLRGSHPWHAGHH